MTEPPIERPHNVELEQALLGAVLINNDAFYRVSDFLEPRHFFEPIHQKLYEIASSLIRVGKTATPVTLKTFLPPDLDVAGLTASQYLARLATEATTVINAPDYGRAIFDLAVRRSLIEIGENIIAAAQRSAIEQPAHVLMARITTALNGLATSNMAEQARAEIGAETLDVVADRGYYDGQEILACETIGITVTLPKPMTSSAKAAGRFGKQDFIYVAADDIYRCPAGEALTYRYTNEKDGKTLRRYWTTACQTCALKAQCTPGKERRISRWEHEAVLETVEDRLDRNPEKMGVRRQTVEHPFGTIKAWMGATHFQMRRLPKVASEMALHVLAYNMKRVMQILGVGGLMAAMLA